MSVASVRNLLVSVTLLLVCLAVIGGLLALFGWLAGASGI